MKRFFLDLASNHGIMAILNSQAVLGSTELDHRMSDAELLPTFEALLKEVGIVPGDLTQLASTIGPGGFTSLRSGLAFMNTLMFGLDLPSCGIHLSDLYRARDAAKNAVWLHSTRRTAVFLRKKDDHEASLVEDLAQLPSLLNGASTWMGELLPEHQQIVESLKILPADLQSLHNVLPAFLEEQSYKKDTLLPWYGRGW